MKSSMKKDNNIYPVSQLGGLQASDDPQLGEARRKAFLIVAESCSRRSQGREVLRDLILALGLEPALTQDECQKLSIRS